MVQVSLQFELRLWFRLVYSLSWGYSLSQGYRNQGQSQGCRNVYVYVYIYIQVYVYVYVYVYVFQLYIIVRVTMIRDKG